MRKLYLSVLLTLITLLFAYPVFSLSNSDETNPCSNRIARGWISLERSINNQKVNTFHFRVIVNEFQYIKFRHEGELYEFYVLGLPFSKVPEFPSSKPECIWYLGIDGNGPNSTVMVFTKQVTEGESWILTTEQNKQLTLQILPDTSNKICYDVTMKLEGMWNKDAYGECVPNTHMEFGYGNEPNFVIIGPGETWESVSDEFKSRVYLKVPIPPEYGEFYGIARAVGEIWTVTINGVSYSATVTEADPNFDIQAFMSCGVKPRGMESDT